MKSLNLKITDQQRKWLDAEMQRLGVPAAEIVRRILDEHIEQKERERRQAESEQNERRNRAYQNGEMLRWRITNPTTGQDFGVHEATDAVAALDSMAQSNGYLGIYEAHRDNPAEFCDLRVEREQKKTGEMSAKAARYRALLKEQPIGREVE